MTILPRKATAVESKPILVCNLKTPIYKLYRAILRPVRHITL